MCQCAVWCVRLGLKRLFLVIVTFPFRNHSLKRCVPFFLSLPCVSTVSTRMCLYLCAPWPSPPCPALCTSSSPATGWWFADAWRQEPNALACVWLTTSKGEKWLLASSDASYRQLSSRSDSWVKFRLVLAILIYLWCVANACVCARVCRDEHIMGLFSNFIVPILWQLPCVI